MLIINISENIYHFEKKKLSSDKLNLKIRFSNDIYNTYNAYIIHLQFKNKTSRICEIKNILFLSINVLNLIETKADLDPNYITKIYQCHFNQLTALKRLIVSTITK